MKFPRRVSQTCACLCSGTVSASVDETSVLQGGTMIHFGKVEVTNQINSMLM